MDYKELQAFTREIIFRCHLATPSTEDETKIYVEGVTLDLINKTSEVLYNIEQSSTIETATESIINAVCEKYKIDRKTIKLRTRKRAIVEPRQIAMHLLKRNTKHSLSQIGKMLGNYDHATVLHASKTVINLEKTDRLYADNFREIKNSISCQ